MDDPCVEIQQFDKQPTPAETNQQSTAYLEIDGMGCANCANRVRNALLKTYGVTSVAIDQPDGLGEVRFNPALVAPEALVLAVQSSGNDGFHHYAARVLALK